MSRLAISQIKKIKEVYSTNVKAYYRNEKTKLIEEKDAIKNSVYDEYKNKITKDIKSKCKNISIKNITWDGYRNFEINFSLRRNIDVVKDVFKTSGIGIDNEYDFYTSADAYIKVDFKYPEIESDEFKNIQKKLESNCKAYKLKMKELNSWELRALENAHTGELPEFKIEATEPTECIV